MHLPLLLYMDFHFQPMLCSHTFCDRQIVLPTLSSRPPPPAKDAYILSPVNCEYVTLHGKGKLRLQMELRLPISWPWEGEIILNFSSRPKCDHTHAYRWKQEAEEREREMAVWERPSLMPLAWNGGRGYLEAGNETDSPLGPPERSTTLLTPWF